MSIMSLLNRVKSGEIVLPNIQREFVWPEDSIAKLMDSIVRGYPIGIILMWETYENIQYREFTSTFIEEADFNYNSNENSNKLLFVLDGQQRLQSLYIALYGKYHGKELYFELLSGEDTDDSSEIKYEFEFADGKEANDWNDESIEKFKDLKNDDPNTNHEKWYYYKVSELYDMSYNEIEDLANELGEKLNLDNNEKYLLKKNINDLKDNLQNNPHILHFSVLE